MMNLILASVLLSALVVTACKNNGQALGNFKNACAAQNGTIAQSDKSTNPTDLMCVLSDKTKIYSK